MSTSNEHPAHTKIVSEGHHQAEASGSSSAKPATGVKRFSSILEHKNVQTGKKFFSAYAKTWVGMSPIWLMGEAVTGKKVGSQFRKGTKELFTVAEELRVGIATSTKDVIVIVDKHLQDTKTDTLQKTAEIIKAAGEDAILVVSTSLIEAQSQIARSSPQLKASVLSNSKDVVVVIDKALKNPIVITGVTKFARAKGIPHPEALLQVASLALSKVMKIIAEEEGKAKEEIEAIRTREQEEIARQGREIRGERDNDGDSVIVEFDAELLESTAKPEAVQAAEKVGQTAEGEAPEVKSDEKETGKGKAKEKDSGCIIM